MLAIYNLALWLYHFAIQIAAFSQPKAKKFINGRKEVWAYLKKELDKNTLPVVWIHCASLGEFEQGRPIIDAIHKKGEHFILLTFFSPSGYEVRKNYTSAHAVCYLPIDNKKNASRFIHIVQPKCAIFVKYEFWYYYLTQLANHNIPSFLIAAHFQENQIFFKWYGNLFRKILSCYQHIFVQDATSINLLNTINISNISISGDTRFDQAWNIAETPINFENIAHFKQNKTLLIAGSTWKEDEKLMKEVWKLDRKKIRIIIAPHEIGAQHIQEIKQLFSDAIVRTWDGENTMKELASADILILNTMGILAYLYRYADYIWIGGGFNRSGIHNITEALVYNKPIAFGPNFSRFREAVNLEKNNGVKSFTNSADIAFWMDNDKEKQIKIAQQYVAQQLGATHKIIHYLVNEKCL